MKKNNKRDFMIFLAIMLAIAGFFLWLVMSGGKKEEYRQETWLDPNEGWGQGEGPMSLRTGKREKDADGNYSPVIGTSPGNIVIKETTSAHPIRYSSASHDFVPYEDPETEDIPELDL